jgi:hypothetical protein
VSAVEALKSALAAGVSVRIDGDDLVLEASTRPASAVLDALSRHKVAIVALLRPAQRGWTSDDWRAYCDKRAGIAKPSGGLPRAKSEAQALACCVIEWLSRHPAPSSPGQCAWCGRSESPGAVVLPFGTEPGTHTWLHAECWPAWHRERTADANAALRAMVIRA